MFSKLFKKPVEPDNILRIDYDDRLLKKNGVITVSLNGTDGHRTDATLHVAALMVQVAGLAGFLFATHHPILGCIGIVSGASATDRLLNMIWKRIPRVIGAKQVLTFTNKEDAMAFVDAQVKGFVKVSKTEAKA